MVVCKFFLQGNCRFGANCRNEHPSGQSGGNDGGGGFGSQNRFGALSNNNSAPNNNRFGGTSDNSKPYTLNVPDIRLDLTRGQGRPSWVLSTYGAGRGTPASLFEGNEYSPEEIRVRFYEMASKGQEAQADQEAIQLWTKAEQDLDNAASHIDDISKFMDEAEKKHPNRYDFLQTDGTKTREELVKAAEASNTTSSGFGATNAFGQPSNNASPFAKPGAANFGQPSGPSAFGASAFGKPAQPSGFGQPAFGQSGFGASTPAFGQSSSPFGQNSSSSSGFGQPATATAFSKPAFGASAFGQSAFGQPSQPSQPSASGTGAFGQAAQPSGQSPFGQSPSVPAFGASAFGQASKPSPFGAAAASPGFGQTAFSQPAQSAPAFGQPAQPAPAFGQQSQAVPAFGQASQPTSGFGQTAFGKPAQPSGFGQAGFGQAAQPTTNSPFGQPATASSGFGTNNTGSSAFGQQQNASPFGQPAQPNINEISMNTDAASSTPVQTQAPANPFSTPQGQTAAVPTTQMTQAAPSAPAAPQPNTNTSQTPHPLTSKPPRPLHYTQTLPAIPPQTNMSKRLTSYRGQQVQYLSDGTTEVPCYNRPDGRGPEKIWFPEAGSTTEVMALNKEDKVADLQEELEKYDLNVKGQYAHLLEEGKFKDGKMPLVAPMREWCVYDF